MADAVCLACGSDTRNHVVCDECGMCPKCGGEVAGHETHARYCPACAKPVKPPQPKGTDKPEWVRNSDGCEGLYRQYEHRDSGRHEEPFTGR